MFWGNLFGKSSGKPSSASSSASAKAQPSGGLPQRPGRRQDHNNKGRSGGKGRSAHRNPTGGVSTSSGTLRTPGLPFRIDRRSASQLTLRVSQSLWLSMALRAVSDSARSAQSAASDFGFFVASLPKRWWQQSDATVMFQLCEKFNVGSPTELQVW